MKHYVYVTNASNYNNLHKFNSLYEAKDFCKTASYHNSYYDELKKHGIHLPSFLTHIRTDECRRIKPTDARMFRMMFLTPRTDGCCGTLDTRPLSNLIMQWREDT